MAESSINVTEGSGKSVETEEVSGKQRQVIIIGGSNGNKATVGTDGLEVEVKKSAIPDGASTSDKQVS